MIILMRIQPQNKREFITLSEEWRESNQKKKKMIQLANVKRTKIKRKWNQV